MGGRGRGGDRLGRVGMRAEEGLTDHRENDQSRRVATNLLRRQRTDIRDYDHHQGEYGVESPESQTVSSVEDNVGRMTFHLVENIII